MKSYNCTSLEQSKTLSKILRIESVDMYYWCGEVLKIGSYKAMDKDLDVPCWSLGALLNYLREIDFFPEIDANELEVTMSINYYNEDEAKPLAPIHNIKVEAESFIDACVEMVLKLHEQKLL